MQLYRDILYINNMRNTTYVHIDDDGFRVYWMTSQERVAICRP